MGQDSTLPADTRENDEMTKVLFRATLRVIHVRLAVYKLEYLCNL